MGNSVVYVSIYLITQSWNVDILSRPVLPIEDAVVEILLVRNDKEKLVRVDIFEDEPLIYYVKTGRHMDGRARGGKFVFNISINLISNPFINK